jgi:hypothetical protein
MSDQTGITAAQPSDNSEAATAEASFEKLDDMEFLDDVDFTLDEVENKIAPLALAHS